MEAFARQKVMLGVTVGARGRGMSRIAAFLGAGVFLCAHASHSQELDFETAVAVGSPPNGLKACVLGGSGATACPSEQGGGPLHRVRLEWKPPPVGKVSRYEVYRYRVVTGNPLRDAINRVALCGTAATPTCGTASTTSFVDAEVLPNGGNFVYFVVAEFDDRTRSGPSNFATITTVD